MSGCECAICLKFGCLLMPEQWADSMLPVEFSGLVPSCLAGLPPATSDVVAGAAPLERQLAV